MAGYAYGKHRVRIRELLASGKLDDVTLDELTALVSGDRSYREVDHREQPPAIRPDDVIRLWAFDRGVVDKPLPPDRRIPNEIRAMFVHAQRVARGDDLED